MNACFYTANVNYEKGVRSLKNQAISICFCLIESDFFGIMSKLCVTIIFFELYNHAGYKVLDDYLCFGHVVQTRKERISEGKYL